MDRIYTSVPAYAFFSYFMDRNLFMIPAKNYWRENETFSKLLINK